MALTAASVGVHCNGRDPICVCVAELGPGPVCALHGQTGGGKGQGQGPQQRQGHCGSSRHLACVFGYRRGTGQVLVFREGGEQRDPELVGFEARETACVKNEVVCQELKYVE